MLAIAQFTGEQRIELIRIEHIAGTQGCCGLLGWLVWGGRRLHGRFWVWLWLGMNLGFEFVVIVSNETQRRGCFA